MKIGIYLGYAPCGKDFSLKKEGLGRYLSFILRGFVENKNEVVIACPCWIVDAVQELIEEANIDAENIKYLTPTEMPVVYRMYFRFCGKEIKIKHKSFRALKKITYSVIDHVMDFMIRTKNFIWFGLLCGLFLALCILCIPIVILYEFIFLFVRCCCKLLFRKNKDVRIVIKDKIESSIKRFLRNENLVSDVKEKMRKDSTQEMIRKIHHMQEPMDIWYCPMSFWDEFHQIHGTKVVCVPDLVTVDFSMEFSKLDMLQASRDVKNTISQGTYFITYCEYLKKTLLIDKFFKEKKDIYVIPHAVNDMLAYIDVGSYFEKRQLLKNANDMLVDQVILPSLSGKNLGAQEYLNYQGMSNFPYKDIRYIFYSSQVRPHKNIRNLVKAYEYILRKKNIPIKLFLTGNMGRDKDLENYVLEHRLQYDVLSFFDVTNQQLAALYKNAQLVVNPTLYEGGFPFTFGEGMSVKTPSVMSDIPQVREVIQGYDLEDCIFDPYDYRDMAEKIIYGLEHTQEIYQRQLKLYHELSKYTWEDVCKDYEKAFQYFIQLEEKDRTDKKRKGRMAI